MNRLVHTKPSFLSSRMNRKSGFISNYPSLLSSSCDQWSPPLNLPPVLSNLTLPYRKISCTISQSSVGLHICFFMNPSHQFLNALKSLSLKKKASLIPYQLPPIFFLPLTFNLLIVFQKQERQWSTVVKNMDSNTRIKIHRHLMALKLWASYSLPYVSISPYVKDNSIISLIVLV